MLLSKQPDDKRFQLTIPLASNFTRNYLLRLWLGIVLSFLFITNTDAKIAQFSELKAVSVQGDVAFTYTQKDTEVWIIRNNCKLLQNDKLSAESAEITLWLEHDSQPVAGHYKGSYRLTIYMEGQVNTLPALNRGFINTKGDGSTRSNNPKDYVWLGEFLLLNKPKISANINRSTPGQMPDSFWRAQRCRESMTTGNSLSGATVVNAAMSDRKTGRENNGGADSFNPKAITQVNYEEESNLTAHNSQLTTQANTSPQSRNGLQALNLGMRPDILNPQSVPLQQGEYRIRVFSRNDVNLNYSWHSYPETNQSVACIKGGVVAVIDGANNFGTIEISTDKLVIWSSGTNPPDLSGNRTCPIDQPIEFYMEGNVVLRESDRTIRADRMYYDLKLQKGTILDTEITTPAEGYDGLLRINAQSVQRLNSREFYAKNAYVTSSTMGKPSYKIQMDDVFINDEVTPEKDPITGNNKISKEGEPVAKHQQYINGKNGTIYLTDTPVFYWPSVKTKLERPTPYISSFRIGSDSIYGFQMFTGWNAYELFNVDNPPEGTDLKLNLDPFSNRGIGHGAVFEFDRNVNYSLFSGPIKGNLDFWGIYDWGKDNLGEGRHSVVPESKYRYKFFGNFRHQFSNNLELTGELGAISDRDFMEEYYRDDWYRQKTPETRLQLRQVLGNFSWDLAVQAKINSFYTETQQLPRLDAYWLGESLLFDRLTWYSHSSMGYYKLSPGSYPEAPENQQFFNYLDWETANSGGRFVTRNELDMPFQLGAVKLVPYVMGEAGWWGASETKSVDRLYGQVGVRASIPIWKAYPCFRSNLFDVQGLVHKVSFEGEWYLGGSTRNMSEMPMYDMLDDQSIIQYRHMFSSTVFGGPIPYRLTERSYALRSGLGNNVTSPATEVLDDIHAFRFNVNQRWQTKRGPMGYEHIVDWITLNAGVTLFPDADRDNFGKNVGLLNYDFNWQLGDRFAVTSNGLWDFFDDGIHAYSIGGRLTKPGGGELAAGVYWLRGTVDNTVIYVNGKYWFNPKWHFSFGSEFDIQGQGNIGQNFAITRVGESLIVRTGFYVDATRDDYGFSLTIEPRFIPKGSLSNSMGGVRPFGSMGLE